MAFNLDKNDGPAKSKFDLSKADASTPDFQEPKKSNKIIWIVLAAVVVIAAVYFFTRKSESETTNQAVADSTQMSANAGSTAQAADSSANVNPTETVSNTATPADFTPVKFPKASAAVGEVDESKLNQVLDYLKSNPSAVINIEGYASSEGTLEFNLKLSESRATNFANFLISKGVKAENIKTSGKGIDNPIASNDNEDGRSQNRRVEIKF